MANKKGAGRPPVAKKNRRDKCITICISLEEQKLIRDLVKFRGFKGGVSKFVRDQLFEKLLEK